MVGKEDVNVENYDGMSKAKKHFVGVIKRGNRWEARIQQPKLKFEVYLGHYSSPEEAALVVKKKKAEFGNMFTGEDSVNVETCRGDFDVGKIPSCARRRGNGMWGGRNCNSEMKHSVSLGSDGTAVEAAVAVDNERAEFWKMSGCSMKDKLDGKSDDKVLKEHECEAGSISECSDELTGDVNLPTGVKNLESSKWEANIRDPVSEAKIWLGAYDTAEEAIRSLNNKKAALTAKRKRSGFDECKFGYKVRPGSEAIEAPVKLESNFHYGCPSSVLGADNLNSIADDDNSSCEVSDVPAKLENTFGHSSPSTTFEPENPCADVSGISKENQPKTVCASDFDEAMSSSFINEYGQLRGKYSEVDEQLRLV